MDPEAESTFGDPECMDGVVSEIAGEMQDCWCGGGVAHGDVWESGMYGHAG